MNINNAAYWDDRFSSGDWETKLGCEQTANFAREQVLHMSISQGFKGVILDFGCGLGDAIPIYRRHFPGAHLLGMDFSVSAIKQCKQRYGDIADFMQGEASVAPQSDIIIASNVVEHLADDEAVIATLLKKCAALYVTTPYRENITARGEHLRSYDKNSYKRFNPYVKIYTVPGWSQHGIALWRDVYMKNLVRPFLGRTIILRSRQIMYSMEGVL
jgi:SAM-dependent methyltransferase